MDDGWDADVSEEIQVFHFEQEKESEKRNERSLGRERNCVKTEPVTEGQKGKSGAQRGSKQFNNKNRKTFRTNNSRFRDRPFSDSSTASSKVKRVNDRKPMVKSQQHKQQDHEVRRLLGYKNFLDESETEEETDENEKKRILEKIKRRDKNGELLRSRLEKEKEESASKTGAHARKPVGQISDERESQIRNEDSKRSMKDRKAPQTRAMTRNARETTTMKLSDREEETDGLSYEEKVARDIERRRSERALRIQMAEMIIRQSEDRELEEARRVAHEKQVEELTKKNCSKKSSGKHKGKIEATQASNQEESGRREEIPNMQKEQQSMSKMDLIRKKYAEFAAKKSSNMK